ncbi:MAG: hypothetical protein LBD23_14205 [Oscillospiraceae bacterium]|jgi:LmbE family N-acetylglucosaminyl deacetylase|nr:hypothetical protein [Oscillospiraceae bacterium]
MKQKKSKMGFYKILLICVAIMLLLLIISAFFLWGYLEAYEASRLENLLRTMQNDVDYDFWETELLNAMKARYTYFEEGDAPLVPHLHTIRNVQYFFRESSNESTIDVPVYTLRAGARDIGVVRFSRAEGVGHGFYTWEVEGIDFLESFVDGLDRSVSITASHNAEVFVNGVLVSQEYRVECDFEYGATYQIDGLFGDIEVTVTEFNGGTSLPEYIYDNNYIFLIIVPYSQYFRVIAPEGASVYANGELVSDEYIIDSQIVPAIFERHYRSGEAPLRLCRYEFELSELYIEPVITATDASGIELPLSISEEGVFMFSVAPSYEYKELFGSLVEEFIMAYFRLNANVGSDKDGNFRTVAEYVVTMSVLHTRLRFTYPQWTDTGSTDIIINSLDIDNFKPYGDRYFTCEVVFDITVQTETGVQEHTGKIEILFTAVDNRWLVLDMLAREPTPESTPMPTSTPPAEDLTDELSISISDGKSAAVLLDRNYSTRHELKQGTTIEISAPEIIYSMYIIWGLPPGEWSLISGNGESGQTHIYGAQGIIHEYIELDNPSRELVINLSNSGAVICDIYAFSKGYPPDWVQVWQPPLEKADMLLIPTHSDDEHLFFVGTLPYYAGERGYAVQVAYLKNHWNQPPRPHELLNGLWAVGVKNYPVIGPFNDRYADSLSQARSIFAWDDVVDFHVELLRRFKPSVVVGHDLNGEYGHGFHRLNAHTLREAVTLAISDDYHASSYERYGVWDTPKLYLHLYQNGTIYMDWSIPLEHFNGSTGYEMAVIGYSFHHSQHRWAFAVPGSGPMGHNFGLVRSTVGPDVIGGDFFENIE